MRSTEDIFNDWKKNPGLKITEGDIHLLSDHITGIIKDKTALDRFCARLSGALKDKFIVKHLGNGDDPTYVERREAHLNQVVIPDYSIMTGLLNKFNQLPDSIESWIESTWREIQYRSSLDRNNQLLDDISKGRLCAVKSAIYLADDKTSLVNYCRNENITLSLDAYNDSFSSNVSALMTAVAVQNIEILKILLAVPGINVNIRPPGIRRTPLETAITLRNPDIIKLLVDNGANLYLKNSLHQLPLDIAEAMGNKPVLDYLRMQYANSIFKRWRDNPELKITEDDIHILKNQIMHLINNKEQATRFLRELTDELDHKFLVTSLTSLDESNYIEGRELHLREVVVPDFSMISRLFNSIDLIHGQVQLWIKDTWHEIRYRLSLDEGSELIHDIYYKNLMAVKSAINRSSNKASLVNYCRQRNLIENQSRGNEISSVSPLMTAVEMQNVEILKILLDVPGINVNITPPLIQRNPLDTAMKLSNSDMIRLLLDQGAKPSPETAAEPSPVDSTLEISNGEALPTVKARSIEDVINGWNDNPELRITQDDINLLRNHITSINDEKSTFEEFSERLIKALDNKFCVTSLVDLNEFNYVQRRAAHLKNVVIADFSIITRLVERFYKLATIMKTWLDNTYCTIRFKLTLDEKRQLIYDVYHNRLDAVKSAIYLSGDKASLVNYCRHENLIIDSNEPNQTPISSVSALMTAVEMKNLEILEVLLAVPGINVNIRPPKIQRTPLQTAINFANSDMVKLLENRGANLYFKHPLHQLTLEYSLKKTSEDAYPSLEKRSIENIFNGWEAKPELTISTDDIYLLIDHITTTIKDKLAFNAFWEKLIEILNRKFSATSFLNTNELNFINSRKRHLKEVIKPDFSIISRMMESFIDLPKTITAWVEDVRLQIEHISTLDERCLLIYDVYHNNSFAVKSAIQSSGEPASLVNYDRHSDVIKRGRLLAKPKASSRSALMTAVEMKNIEMLKILLAVPGINVNILPPGTLKTPLQMAIMYDDSAMINLLVDHGANPHFKYPLHQLTLDYSVKMNKGEALPSLEARTVEKIFDNWKTNPDLKISEDDIQTFIDHMTRTVKNNDDFDEFWVRLTKALDLKFLVTTSGDVNDINFVQRRKTHLEDVFKADFSIITQLIESFINLPPSIHLWVETTRKEIEYRSSLDERSQLIDDIYHERLLAVKSAIQHSNDKASLVNYCRDVDLIGKSKAQSKRGISSVSALMTAVETQNIEIINILLAVPGINVNIRLSGTNRTPLEAAIRLGNLEMTQLLVDQGADLHLKGSNQQLPIDHALKVQNPELLKYLIEAYNTKADKFFASFMSILNSMQSDPNTEIRVDFLFDLLNKANLMYSPICLINDYRSNQKIDIQQSLLEIFHSRAQKIISSEHDERVLAGEISLINGLIKRLSEQDGFNLFNEIDKGLLNPLKGFLSHLNSHQLIQSCLSDETDIGSVMDCIISNALSNENIALIIEKHLLQSLDTNLKLINDKISSYTSDERATLKLKLITCITDLNKHYKNELPVNHFLHSLASASHKGNKMPVLFYLLRMGNKSKLDFSTGTWKMFCTEISRGNFKKMRPSPASNTHYSFFPAHRDAKVNQNKSGVSALAGFRSENKEL